MFLFLYHNVSLYLLSILLPPTVTGFASAGAKITKESRVPMSIIVIITAGRQRLTGHKKGSKNLYIAALAEGVRIGCV